MCTGGGILGLGGMAVSSGSAQQSYNQLTGQYQIGAQAYQDYSGTFGQDAVRAMEPGIPYWRGAPLPDVWRGAEITEVRVIDTHRFALRSEYSNEDIQVVYDPMQITGIEARDRAHQLKDILNVRRIG